MFKKRNEIKKVNDYLQLYGPYCTFYIKKTKSSLEHTQARLVRRLLGNLSLMLLLLLSHFSRVQLCVTQQTAAHQAPPSLGFSRQEY